MSVIVERASGPVRKKQIKKATLDIIYNEGLKNLSTRNLEQHVHLSEGAIFRHFHSKSEIILSIMEDVKNDLLVELQHIANKKTSPERRLQEFICYHVKYLKENKGVTILLFTEAAYQNNDLLKKQLNEFFRLIKRALVN
ncbi:MAG TPA: TetR/AcrR family transcriptional regulator [Bacteroidetes bacterium]|nr:TetR/AcrR family transcriptional regulator [Bacteroidota bacterium]